MEPDLEVCLPFLLPTDLFGLASVDSESAVLFPASCVTLPCILWFLLLPHRDIDTVDSCFFCNSCESKNSYLVKTVSFIVAMTLLFIASRWGPGKDFAKVQMLSEVP